MERDKFIGSLIGCAIGDAIGELAFFCKEKDRLFKEIQQRGILTYTDDTAMTIGIAKALLEKRDVDEEYFGDMLAKEFYKEPWRGYASGPPTVFAMVKERNIPYSKAAGLLFDGKGSYGNGAAMRIAPIGLFFHNLSKEDFYKKAASSARITHAHHVGIDGAVVQAKAVAIALELKPNESFSYKEFLDELISISKTDQIRNKLLDVKELLDKESEPKEAISKLGKSVAVHESMPFSIYSFLKYHHSFVDCLLCSVLHGGDRDTLGAMACAICGAYLGVDSIPKEWIKKLENSNHIKSLAEGLYEMHIDYCRI